MSYTFVFFRFGTFQLILRKNLVSFPQHRTLEYVPLLSFPQPEFQTSLRVAYPQKGRLNQRAANAFQPRDYKGDRESIPHIHPIIQVIRLELFLEPQIPRGIGQQPITQRECIPRGRPTLEPRVLHELTRNKMGEDAESDFAIPFVDENDYSEISAKAVSAKRKLKKNRPSSLVQS